MAAYENNWESIIKNSSSVNRLVNVIYNSHSINKMNITTQVGNRKHLCPGNQ